MSEIYEIAHVQNILNNELIKKFHSKIVEVSTWLIQWRIYLSMVTAVLMLNYQSSTLALK